MPIAFVLLLALCGVQVQADTLEAFKSRIESAIGHDDKDGAVRALFYQQGLSEEMQGMLDMVVVRVARRDHVQPSFVDIPEEAQLVAVVDGFEYRPNINVLGYVDLGKNNMGGNTKAPYGLAADGRYYFSATTKTLVNADAKPDRQLQMIAIGSGHPAVTFDGWCDILQSNNEIIRKTLSDQGIGNQTLIMRGQQFESCELNHTGSSGGLSLRLMVDDDVVFEQHTESPDDRIVYDAGPAQ